MHDIAQQIEVMTESSLGVYFGSPRINCIVSTIDHATEVSHKTPAAIINQINIFSHDGWE